MTIHSLRKILIILVLSVSVFLGGYGLGREGYKADIKKFPKVTITRETPVDRQELNFSLFWRVWDTLTAKYFDKSELNPAAMVYGAIRGMVSAVGDPYTVFLEPNENKVVQEDLNGSFEGIGIQIGFKGTQLAVIAPLPDSPAEAAGVKAGDFIIGIKDEGKNIERGTVGISLPEAVQAIRGRAGTKVTLTLLREGETEPIVVEIARKELNVPTLIVTYVGEGGSLAHVKLLKFGGETEEEWQKTVREISRKEILAGALRDARGVQLVGEKTFGKGTIQEPLQLDGGSGLHITIARWLTPSGFWVNGEGLTPDFVVEDDPETAEDEQLEKAIELLK